MNKAKVLTIKTCRTVLAPLALAAVLFLPAPAPDAPWRATERNIYGWALATYRVGSLVEPR